MTAPILTSSVRSHGLHTVLPSSWKLLADSSQ